MPAPTIILESIEVAARDQGVNLDLQRRVHHAKKIDVRDVFRA